MRLIDFMREFPDEQSCERKLKEYREAPGVVWPHCGSTEYYWKGDKKSFSAAKPQRQLRHRNYMPVWAMDAS